MATVTDYGALLSTPMVVSTVTGKIAGDTGHAKKPASYNNRSTCAAEGDIATSTGVRGENLARRGGG